MAKSVKPYLKKIGFYSEKAPKEAWTSYPQRHPKIASFYCICVLMLTSAKHLLVSHSSIQLYNYLASMKKIYFQAPYLQDPIQEKIKVVLLGFDGFQRYFIELKETDFFSGREFEVNR